jgi:Rad51 protein
MAARLHYLYDQREGGKERFIYSCSSCDCVLRVRRDLGPTGETLDSVNGRCFGCGRALEESIECRLTEVPDEWSDIYLSAPKTVERRTPLFRPASSYPHFSLGFPHLDSLLRPFAPGFMAVVTGAEAQVVAELAAFRAQLPLEVGGLNSTVVFIDGGNRSNPYLFSSFARQHDLRPGAAMRRITTCRVFTMYQLADLVSKHLVPVAADYAAQLVVISDLLGTFNEPELDEREARRLLSSVEQAVSEVKKNALVLVTLVSPSSYDGAVVSWADTAVNLTSADGTVRAELLKHPSKPHTISSFKLNQLLMQKAVR